eukprot:1315205-Pyramimonas_sp.AAC.1
MLAPLVFDGKAVKLSARCHAHNCICELKEAHRHAASTLHRLHSTGFPAGRARANHIMPALVGKPEAPSPRITG